LVSTELFGLVQGVFTFTGEQAVEDDGAIWLSALLFLPQSGVAGSGVAAGYAWYPSGHVLRGVYLAPGLGTAFVTDGDADATVFTVGGDVGYRWLFPSGLAAGGSVGLAYASASSTYGGVGTGFVPGVSLQVGKHW
jgi:hypothetical protein